MKCAKLLSMVLIVGLFGCSGSDGEKKSSVDQPDVVIDKPTVDMNSSVAKIEPAETESAKTAGTEAFEFNNATFDAPIMLMAAGQPMRAGHSYPSPAVFDVDNDGDVEMVIGEIMGTVSYCENENKSDGDPVWSAVQPMLTADGKPLKLNNW